MDSTSYKMKHIDEAIEKWEKILNHGGVDYLSMNCSLCEHYHCEVGYRSCYDIRLECPLLLVNKCCNNEGSPWWEWHLHQYRMHPKCEEHKVHGECCKPYAEAMLNALKELKENTSWMEVI